MKKMLVLIGIASLVLVGCDKIKEEYNEWTTGEKAEEAKPVEVAPVTPTTDTVTAPVEEKEVK